MQTRWYEALLVFHAHSAAEILMPLHSSSTMWFKLRLIRWITENQCVSQGGKTEGVTAATWWAATKPHQRNPYVTINEINVHTLKYWLLLNTIQRYTGNHHYYLYISMATSHLRLFWITSIFWLPNKDMHIRVLHNLQFCFLVSILLSFG